RPSVMRAHANTASAHAHGASVAARSDDDTRPATSASDPEGASARPSTIAPSDPSRASPKTTSPIAGAGAAPMLPSAPTPAPKRTRDGSGGGGGGSSGCACSVGAGSPASTGRSDGGRPSGGPLLANAMGSIARLIVSASDGVSSEQ